MYPTKFRKYICQCKRATFFLYNIQFLLHINQHFGTQVLNTNTNDINILYPVIFRQQYPPVMKCEIYALQFN